MVGRYLRLFPAERALLRRVLLLVVVVRVSLWLIPFSVLRRFLQQPTLGLAFPSRLVDLPPERLAWAVEAASRRVPAATCLTQSLALQFLLSRSGRRSLLRIGVAKDHGCDFKAHAWVDCAGQVLLDRPEEVARYTPLAVWEDR
jgi:hypothetical protein